MRKHSKFRAEVATIMAQLLIEYIQTHNEYPTYGELKKIALVRFPNNQNIKKYSVWFHAGGVFYAIAEATYVAGLPDIGAPVRNAHTKTAGDGMDGFSIEYAEMESLNYNWNNVTIQIEAGPRLFNDVRDQYEDTYNTGKYVEPILPAIEAAKKQSKLSKQARRDQVLNEVCEYFKENKERITKYAKSMHVSLNGATRDDVVNQVLSGVSIDEAYTFVNNCK